MNPLSGWGFILCGVVGVLMAVRKLKREGSPAVGGFTVSVAPDFKAVSESLFWKLV